VSGQRFHVNVPFEESYTTPDARRTRGRLVASRPFRPGGGELVRDLVLEFRDGRVVEIDASQGRDAFAEWLAVDEGARRLGEIALVGEDSPLARTGLFFDLPLLDENAACHAALGDAYRAALAGGLDMDRGELDEIGCNRSAVHSDLVFGSPQVSVTATESREGEVVLIADGARLRLRRIPACEVNLCFSCVQDRTQRANFGCEFFASYSESQSFFEAPLATVVDGQSKTGHEPIPRVVLGQQLQCQSMACDGIRQLPETTQSQASIDQAARFAGLIAQQTVHKERLRSVVKPQRPVAGIGIDGTKSLQDVGVVVSRLPAFGEIQSAMGRLQSGGQMASSATGRRIDPEEFRSFPRACVFKS
jgi:hypothetical protein